MTEVDKWSDKGEAEPGKYFNPAQPMRRQDDAVNHPPHYGGDTTYEVIKVLQAWGLYGNAHLWNAVKYIARAGKKADTPMLQDLKKAKFYLDWEIQRLEKLNETK
jgi:hypothetical protein